MKTIIIPGAEYFDNVKQEFIYSKEQTLQLEHSLISISKWESIWHKPYLDDKDKTPEEALSYIKCMTINNVDPNCYTYLTQQNINDISDYINDSMTATWFSDDDKKKSTSKKEIITSELIYYWMVAFQIPSEYQKWHINRLLTLVRICQVKNEPEKKMSKQEAAAQRRALNAQRRARANSKG